MRNQRSNLIIGFASALLSFCLLSGALICHSQSNPAYSVAGFVRNELDAFIPNATVTLTLNRTGESQMSTTDALGRYIFDLGTLEQGYEYDDLVFVVATKNSLSGFGTGTVIESGVFITINITIRDVSRPMLYSTPPQFSAADEGVHVSAALEDDIEVQSSNVYYMPPGESAFKNESLALQSGSTSAGVWAVALPEPMSIGKFFYYIVAYDTALNINATDIFSFDVLNGRARGLEITAPSEVDAGDMIDVACQAVDKYGNHAINYTGTVSLLSTDPAQVAQASTYAHTYILDEKGTYTFGNITLCTAPIQTITAQDASNGLENNFTIIVNPGLVERIKIYPNITTVVAGTGGVFSARLVDGFSNVVSSESGLSAELHTTSTTGTFSPSANIAFPSGTSSVSFLYTDTNVTGSPYTLSALSSTLGTENASVFIVSSDVDRWALKANASVLVAGSNLSVNVSIVDKFNNSVVLADNTTVNLRSSSASGIFYFNGQKVNSAVVPKGTGWIWVDYYDCSVANSPVFLSAGNGTFIADGMFQLDIIHASPAHISLNAPATVTANEQFNVTAKIYDRFGNLVNDFAGFVNLSVGSVKETKALTTADEGIASFNLLSINTAGEYNLSVECKADNTLLFIARLTVIPGEVKGFNLSGPEIVEAGNPFDIVVFAMDTWGNVVANYTGTVVFSSSDDYPARLPGTYTFLTGDRGLHMFSGFVLFLLPLQTIEAVDVDDASINGSAEFFIYDDTPPAISYDAENGTSSDSDRWTLTVNATDDISVRKAVLFYGFDNLTFMESEMSQESGNQTTGIGTYSVSVPVGEQKQLFFYFGVFDGQNWVFLESEAGGAFSSVYEGGQTIYYLILILIIIIILVCVLIFLKRKRRK